MSWHSTGMVVYGMQARIPGLLMLIVGILYLRTTPNKPPKDSDKL